MSVVSYINHQAGARSKALYKQAANLLLWTDRHFLFHQSSAHPRSPEPRDRNAFEEEDSSRRVEAASRVSSDDLDPLRESGGGSVRHERECVLPALLLPVSLPTGRGRSDIALASSQAGPLNKSYRRLLGVVERYVYSGYMLCSRLVFSKYLRQVLQSGCSVLSLPNAVDSSIPIKASYTPADTTEDAVKSDAGTQSNSSTPTTSQNTNITEGTTEIPCQYSLMKSVNKTEAYVVNINGSKDQIYTIRIKDKHNEIRAEQISNRTAFKIPFEWLKPCTVYTVSVDDCKPSGSNTFTSSENGETVPNTVVTSVTDNKVCLKGIFNDNLKWDLTECVEITEQNSCASTHTVVLDTCTYTMNVALHPVKPDINFKETIPSQFEWMNKSARCNATLIINCTNNENDWQKNGRFQHRYTSLEISWNSLEGHQCSGFKWDSYSANCSDGSSHRGSCTKHSGTSAVCRITGLLPYKNYTCSIIGTVNQKHYVIYTSDSATLSASQYKRTKNGDETTDQEVNMNGCNVMDKYCVNV
ncbi:receptor-type tyrosine-protein phosphatase C-like [Sinocyclocheilus anshuiensis]|uniref:receptor-type tyrosine-protein phosphatase C-like n=1 Tax=Sinocyclocheilus anshuiensis TaxID=1608454 RepID=UPI0007BA90BF|nr:PREDICTED: receptor-type tyrosine-protein phosphatase C-like [Sinocyclocheilus anshuiensis]